MNSSNTMETPLTLADDRLSLSCFLRRYGISSVAERTDDNPSMDDESRSRMDHWRVTLRKAPRGGKGRRTMTVLYSMGYGHGGRHPSTEDVLECLALDAQGVENARSFEEWASEYGYDADSRRAEKTYRATVAQTKRLKRFLGHAEYRLLLCGVDF
jgi:hypothetical protein